MKLVLDIIGELFRRRPGDWTERLTPWILTILGGLILSLMFYSCATAPEELPR